MLSAPWRKNAFMDTFGERLEAALDGAKKTRKGLAEELKISVQAVGQAVRGESSFTAANTAKAARYLRVNWYWLATGDESMEITDVQLSADERSILRKIVDVRPEGGATVMALSTQQTPRAGLGLQKTAGQKAVQRKTATKAKGRLK